MTALAQLVHLGDLDLLLREAHDEASRLRLRKLGFDVGGLDRLAAVRARFAAAIERRWVVVYERARQRYGRGVAAVRERVCQGCFVTLPTSAPFRPGTGETPGLCASCGRVLFWG
jgi:predicted  nucleic acid-binding Zn-ribbon protein